MLYFSPSGLLLVLQTHPWVTREGSGEGCSCAPGLAVPCKEHSGWRGRACHAAGCRGPRGRCPGGGSAGSAWGRATAETRDALAGLCMRLHHSSLYRASASCADTLVNAETSRQKICSTKSTFLLVLSPRTELLQPWVLQSVQADSERVHLR